MLSRNEAINILQRFLINDENIKKSYAAEAILKNIAKFLNKDQELWARVGLLHNIDYEMTKGDPEKRGVLAETFLKDLLPDEGINAIKADNYIHTDYVPVTSLDRVTIATISFLGLLFYILKDFPDKSIKDINVPIFYDFYKNKEYAQQFQRNRINIITNIGISIQDFFKISLDSVKEISEKLENL